MDWALVELLFQGSCCLMEILATSSNVGAGVAGVKARRRIKQRRQAIEEGTPAPSSAGPIATFFVLLILGVILTVAVILKWLRI